MIIVNSFLWQKIDDDSYFFQTQTTATIITNKKIVEFLIQTEKNRILRYDEDDLKTIFGNEYEDILNFLCDNNILKKDEKKQMNIERLVVVSEDSIFTSMIEAYFSDEYSIHIINEIDLDEFAFGENDLLLSFIKEFAVEKLERLRNYAEKNNAFLKVIFPYNSRIYFTNIYKKQWYTPCPLCFYYELESQLRGEAGEYSITFQTLMDFVYQRKSDFIYEVILKGSDYINIGHVLSENLKSEIPEKKISEIAELDLENGKVNKDISYHWGYCDCYE